MGRQKLIHLHSSGTTEPSSSALELGEIAVQYNSEDSCLWIKDNEGNLKKFIKEGAIQTMIDNRDIDCGFYYATYLTFEAVSANSTVQLNRIGTDTTLQNAVLQYSTNSGETWNNYTLGDTITLANTGDTVMFKGINGSLGYDDSNYHKFEMTGKIKANGDITSLNNELCGDIPMSAYCYYGILSGCTSLTTAPELPSTILAQNCYDSMFQGCTSLTEAPELPATTLANCCYQSMFEGCSNLNYINAKFTTTPSTAYTNNWTSGVSQTGTFVKDPESTWLIIGVNGIPTGWAVDPVKYLTFEALSANSTVQLNRTGTATTLQNAVLEYSTDNGETWNNYSFTKQGTAGYSGDTITLSNVGDTVKFKGNNGTLGISNSNYHRFVMTGKIKAVGDITSLNNEIGCDIPMSDYCYYNMFYGCTSLTTPPELPATTLAFACYWCMFRGCTSLIEAPELPATTLGQYCYESMFSGCTSLTTVHGLPATTLADYCYQYMFQGCTSLTNVPSALPATTATKYCYSYMFHGCTSLETAPELPATTLASYCYQYMFQGCTSLTTAPELPATNLSSTYYCYYCMFRGCTSLIEAPELPATTLGSDCYGCMFSGCTSLTTAPELPATSLANSCYKYMFANCTFTSAPELPATTLGAECYKGMFAYCSALTNVQSALPATTLVNSCYAYMFSGCTSLTTAPILPATTLGYFCCEGMFMYCTSLANVQSALPATTLAQCCYRYMFQYCSSLVTAPELPATVFSYSNMKSCYELMFYGCSNLNYIKALFTTEPSTTYTQNWVNGVSQTGTFIKNAAATWTNRGVHSIPTGWNIEYPPQYLTFEAVSANSTVKLNRIGTATTLQNAVLQYSTNSGQTWNNYSFTQNSNGYLGDTIELENIGDTVMFKGNNGPLGYDDSNYHQFVMTGKIKAINESDVTSLNNEVGLNIPMSAYCYYMLFKGCTSLTEAPELPSKSLGDYCYANMFQGCTSLTTAPELPATTLANYCYQEMFDGCTSLTATPELLATTLKDSCYSNMFKECNSLLTVNKINATTLAASCCTSMFEGCTSLTNVPSALPATMLADYCYANMFQGCTSLTKSPELPATTLAQYCYADMFNDCALLTESPTLVATTLVSNCYSNMFKGCSSLNTILAAFTTTPSTAYTDNWVSGVSQTGTFYKSPESTWEVNGDYGVPIGWTIIKNKYLTFEAVSANSTVKLNRIGTATTLQNAVLQYSTDNGQTWNNYSFTKQGTAGYSGSTISLSNVGDTVKFIGYNGCLSESNYSNHHQFVMTGKIKASGNITSLNNRIYPNVPMSAYCYYMLFKGCTSLTEAPELPATTLATYCYYSMFQGCTSLTTAPELPSTTLYPRCYESMFLGCSSLNYIKAMFTTTPSNSYTYNWVSGVSQTGTFYKNIAANWDVNGVNGIPNGWTVIPNHLTFEAVSSNSTVQLNRIGTATTLQNAILQYSTDNSQTWDNYTIGSVITLTNIGDTVMFKGINGSLGYDGSNYHQFIMTGEIKASGDITSLNNEVGLNIPMSAYCYNFLFSGCTALTEMPNLPSTALAEKCYQGMFAGCTSLTTGLKLPATTLVQGCYNFMFYGCSNLNYINAMFTTTPTTAYTDNWVSGVSQTGIFNKNKDAIWNVNGVHGVPTGWIIINYLTFEAVSANSTVQLLKFGGVSGSLQYSIDNGDTWNNYSYRYNSGNTITLSNVGDTVMFKGINGSLGYDGSKYHKFVMTGKIKASGDITSLNNEVGGDIPMSAYCYYDLFYGCTSLTEAPNLPSTTLADSCYSNMFNSCTSLTTASELPATTLAKNCYYYMFNRCTSLTTAPELPATTLAQYCYYYMFNRCTSLTNVQSALPATTVPYAGYQGMFAVCTSLTTAPELLATKIGSECYESMFEGCTSLTNVPSALPATTLAGYCYSYMFKDCTSLTTAPKLPATNFSSTNSCYLRMFQGCTSLTTAPELPATYLGQNCYQYMFYGCSNLNYIKAMFTTTPSTAYTQNWVNGVASAGTFVKNVNATWTNTGVDAVPTGWTIETASS